MQARKYSPEPCPAHPIDYLERASPSDTVDIEVKADSYCCLLLDVSG
jgi:hypothetical protein